MQLPWLDEAELRRRLDMPAAIEAMRSAFAQLSDGRARIPVRTGVEGDGTLALFMPGWLPAEGALGGKIVTVRPGNAEEGRPLVHAIVLLIDPDTGIPEAVLDATWLTALRTGAASGLATELLALPDAEVLAVVGAGVQARAQVEAVLAVRPIRQIRVRSRSAESAERFAAELRAGGCGVDPGRVEVRVVSDPVEQLAGAQVVVTATDARDAVLPAAVDPGTHINAVGAYTPEMRELPGELVARATVIVDQREAAWAEAGDLVLAVAEGVLEPDERLPELGEVVAGRHPGRTTWEEVTVFKSVGSAAQDLAVARRACAGGVGSVERSEES